MRRIKLLGPIKKSLPNYQTKNYFDLSENEYELTIEEIFKARNIQISKYYSYYVESKRVALNYVLKEGETLIVIPILTGG